MTCNAWRDEAKRLLRQGYGMEDIGVKLGVPADDVRRFVRALRLSGRLKVVLFGVGGHG